MLGVLTPHAKHADCTFNSAVNLTWAFGQLVGAGVQSGVSGITTQWAYRIPFAIQWIWPLPIAIGVALAPESPWWHVGFSPRNHMDNSLMWCRFAEGIKQGLEPRYFD